MGPLLPGESDIDQLAKMTSALGSIDTDAWPEVTTLPDWGKIMFSARPPTPLEALLPDAPSDALILLSKLIR